MQRTGQLSYAPRVLGAALELFGAELPVRFGVGLPGALVSPVAPCQTPITKNDVEVGPWRARLGLTARKLEELVDLDASRPDAKYHLARVHIVLGDEAAAHAAVDRLLEEHPDFVPGHVLDWRLATRGTPFDEAAFDRRFARWLGGSDWGAAWIHAVREQSAGRWKKAAAAYGRVIASSDRNEGPFAGAEVEAYVGRGVAFLEARQYHAAARDFAVAQGLWSDFVEADLLCAKAYLLAGERSEAEGLFESLNEAVGPARRREIATWVTAIYCQKNDFDGAIAWADRVNEAFSHRVRGFLEYFRWHNAAAVESSRRAIEADPEDDYSWKLLGFALLEHVLGRSGRLADADFRQLVFAAECDTNSSSAAEESLNATLLACVRMVESRPEDAVEHSRRSVALLGDASALAIHASTLALSGRLEEAEAAARRALALRPRSRYTLGALGRVLERQGRLDEAADAYRRVIASRPGRSIGYGGLAGVLLRQNRFAEAATICEKAIDLPPHNSPVHELLALARFRLSQPGEALRSVERGLGRVPDRARLHWMRAVVLAGVGRRDEALQSLLRSFGVDAGGGADARRIDALLGELANAPSWRIVPARLRSTFFDDLWIGALEDVAGALRSDAVESLLSMLRAEVTGETHVVD